MNHIMFHRGYFFEYEIMYGWFQSTLISHVQCRLQNTFTVTEHVVLISDLADFRNGPDLRLRWFQKPRKMHARKIEQQKELDE